MENALPSAHSVNVRTLAETYYEGGDLFADLSRIDRMQEGLKGHLLLQAAYPPEYRAEVPVKLTCEVAGVSLAVQGRVDGLILEADACTVEEIKTTRQRPEQIHEDDYPAHWAQAQMYAYIVCETRGLPAATVRLMYYNLSGARASFTRAYTREKLAELFYTYARCYALRLKQTDDWKTRALPSMRALAFPFSSFRAGQREMAARAYLAIRDHKKLLVEAPTGIGKTAGALFPALKALGEGKLETIFYLTARTTGRRAAEDALARMREGGLCARSVTISAKKKQCPMPEVKCNPETCPFARGYFDRQQQAVNASYAAQALTGDAIGELARRFQLCPFELSLCLAETADVVICDYNYVFDPMVRLRRFFDRRGAYALLVDEAHNLVPRAREMYSAEVGAREISALRREVGRAEGKQSPLYLALTAFYQALDAAEEEEARSEIPMKLVDAAKVFSDEAKTRLSGHAPFQSMLVELFFGVSSFLRASGEFEEETHRTLYTPEGKRSRVKIWCWNPEKMLAAAMKRMRGVVLFSATLSPIAHYARLLTLSEDAGDQFLSLPSPFPRENLFSAKLSIPTRYRAREDSAPRVAQALYALAQAKRGNYLACFPSHAYLNQVAQIFASRYPDVRVLLQTREMTERAREEYLANFTNAPDTSMVAFVAMGGVFSEGIDLPGEKLIGAAIVGVGLPQLCFERNALCALWEEAYGGGYETAYVYPGIGKCLQAAGRVIRTETDRGAVLFIDDRYALPEYRALMPAHLAPKPVKEEALPAALRAFWASDSGA